MTVQNSRPILNETKFLILLSLASRSKHGYDIAKDIQELSRQRVILSVGTLYSTIRRMLADGLIERSGEQPEENGQSWKTYSLTEQGRRMLAAETTRRNSLKPVAGLRGMEA